MMKGDAEMDVKIRNIEASYSKLLHGITY